MIPLLLPVIHGYGRILLPVIVLFLIACERSPYPGYKKIGEDIHLRLYLLGEGDRLPLDGDSALMRLRISETESPAGSLLSTEQWFAVEDLRNSAFDQLLIRMHEGDSMSLITRSDRMPWPVLLMEEDTLRPAGSGMVRVEASLIAVRTAAMIAEEEILRREENTEAYEQELTAEFMQRLGPDWKRWGTSDIHYFIQGPVMDTAQVRAGDVVTISYTGRRVEDGTIFDSTVNNGGPMTFRFGDKGQVVNGLEVAISLLREGQEGEFFLPSEYAFGSRGVEGMIEPYTPVLYGVRLEEVQRRRPRKPAL
jgi:FKBP-type peptidyl-prolyl cis-trans isomerase FkpA